MSHAPDPWMLVYRRLVPELVAYTSANGHLAPTDDVVRLVGRAARCVGAVRGDGRALRLWAFILVVDAVAKARRASPAMRDAIPDPLRGLSDDERDVIWLREIAGFSVAETAMIMRKRARRVEKIERRALTSVDASSLAPLRETYVLAPPIDVSEQHLAAIVDAEAC